MKFAEVLQRRQADEAQRRAEELERADAVKQQLQQKKDSLRAFLGEVEEMEEKKGTSIESVKTSVDQLKTLIEEHKDVLEAQGIENVKELLASYQEAEDVKAYEEQKSAHKVVAQAISERGREIVQELPEEVRPKPKKLEHERVQSKRTVRYANLNQIKEAIQEAIEGVDKEIFWLTPEGQRAKREEVRDRIENRHAAQKGVKIDMTTYDAFERERFVERDDVVDARRYGEELYKGQLLDFHHERIDGDAFLKFSKGDIFAMQEAFNQIDQLPEQYTEALRLIDELQAAYNECDTFIREICAQHNITQDRERLELLTLALRLRVFDNFVAYSGGPQHVSQYFKIRKENVQTCQPFVEAVKRGGSIMEYLASPDRRGLQGDIPDNLFSLVAQAKKELQRWEAFKEAIQADPNLLNDTRFPAAVEAKLRRSNPEPLETIGVGKIGFAASVHQELGKYNSYGEAKEQHAHLLAKVDETLTGRVDAKCDYEWQEQSLKLYKDTHAVEEIQLRLKRKETLKSSLGKLESYFNGLSDEEKDEPVSVVLGERGGFSMASARSLTFESELTREAQSLAQERDRLQQSIDSKKAEKVPFMTKVKLKEQEFNKQKEATITTLQSQWQAKATAWEEKNRALSKHIFFTQTIVPELRERCDKIIIGFAEAEEAKDLRNAFSDYKGSVGEFVPLLREKVLGASAVSPQEDVIISEYKRLIDEEQLARERHGKEVYRQRNQWHVIKE